MNNELCFNGFSAVTENEMFNVDGGGPSPKDKAAAHVNMANMHGGESVAIAYTLGYLSLATCFCGPVSFAFGFAGLMYTCATAK